MGQIIEATSHESWGRCQFSIGWSALYAPAGSRVSYQGWAKGQLEEFSPSGEMAYELRHPLHQGFHSHDRSTVSRRIKAQWKAAQRGSSNEQ